MWCKILILFPLFYGHSTLKSKYGENYLHLKSRDYPHFEFTNKTLKEVIELFMARAGRGRDINNGTVTTQPVNRILMEGPWITQSLQTKLKEGFDPFYLEVINESYMHNVPKDAETHFKVVIGSDKFDGVSLVQRHRMVNSLFEREFANGLHALSIVAKTKKEMENYLGTEPSPTCRGGFGK